MKIHSIVMGDRLYVDFRSLVTALRNANDEGIGGIVIDKESDMRLVEVDFLDFLCTSQEQDARDKGAPIKDNT